MRNLFKLKNHENQRGVAAVEFAIVLPLLLFLFIGITEFGLAYYNKQVITNASREGARAGIVADHRGNTTYLEGIVEAYSVDRLITFGSSDVSSYINIDLYYRGDEESSSWTTTHSSDSKYFKVDVTFRYTYLILAGFKLFGADFGPNLDIKASTVMRMEPAMPDSD